MTAFYFKEDVQVYLGLFEINTRQRERERERERDREKHLIIGTEYVILQVEQKKGELCLVLFRSTHRRNLASNTGGGGVGVRNRLRVLGTLIYEGVKLE
jgi:hypothetical protein